ncbi:hypothetical protein HZA96_01735 [Candidatus Woesearchaeota archaeon]|nr:hypothetical protein [Candidatus Woesearchaeota archaeon]
MEDEKLTLLDWAYYYAKNKDVLTRTIANIEKKQNELFITHKNKTQKYFVVEHLLTENKENKAMMDAIIKELQHNKQDTTKFYVIVFYNTKENFQYLIKNWNLFIDFPSLAIIFTNPDSKTDKRWVVQPYTHNKITEKSALESGLKSLFETVEVC